MRKFEKIRTAIKELSTHQLLLKRQRKQSYIGERVSGDHSWNRNELRHLFQAYAILRGKERPKVFKSEIYETKVQKLVEQYKPLEEIQTV